MNDCFWRHYDCTSEKRRESTRKTNKTKLKVMTVQQIANYKQK